MLKSEIRQKQAREVKRAICDDTVRVNVEGIVVHDTHIIIVCVFAYVR